MSDTWDDILNKAKKQTEDKFASRISSLTRLTDDEIKDIAPTPGDRERLAQLLGIVAGATTSNKEKADAINEVAGAVELLVPIVKKLIVIA